MACLIKISEYIRRVYGDHGSHPARQTIVRQCKLGKLPAEQKGNLWYIKWDIYQKQTGDDLVDKVLGS